MDNFSDLLGTPFKYGGRGDGFYDCYGLIMDLMLRDGTKIPDYLSPSEGAKIMAIFISELRLWEEAIAARGAIHLFRIPGNYHVGYALDADRFIHTWEESGGVIIERLSEDNWHRRLIGTYKYVGE